MREKKKHTRTHLQEEKETRKLDTSNKTNKNNNIDDKQPEERYTTQIHDSKRNQAVSNQYT